MNPETQFNQQAALLNTYLAKQGIARWVEPAIAMAEALPDKNVAASPILVWLPFTVERLAHRLAIRTLPSAAALAQINVLLGKRADAQRASEAERQKHGTASLSVACRHLIYQRCLLQKGQAPYSLLLC